MGTISRGTGTRFTSPALSTIEVVPEIHAIEKKLNGIIPQSTNTGKCWMGFLENTRVKTKVRTPIMTRGFTSDHNMPSDMFRYRIRKSFRIRFSIR
jgi:hypothetical protein